MKNLAQEAAALRKSIEDFVMFLDSFWHNYDSQVAKEDLKEVYLRMEQIYQSSGSLRYRIKDEKNLDYYGKYLNRMGRMCIFLEGKVYWEVFDEILKMFSGFICNREQSISLQIKTMYNILEILSCIGEENMLHRKEDEHPFEEQEKLIKKWKREIRFSKWGLASYERLNLAYQDEVYELKQTRGFDSSMRSIKKMMSYCENVGCSKKTLIDYLIDIIGNDIRYDCFANIIYGKEDNGFLELFPRKYLDGYGNEKEVRVSDQAEVDFKEVCVMSIPWKHKRIPKNLAGLLGKEFCYDENNHFGTYYPEINICYVENGIHSVAIGVQNNQGKIMADLFSLEPLFGRIYTDGASWYSTYKDIRLGDLEDFRLGVLFELAQMKHKIAE